jgi:hypothetical protein
VRFEINLKGLFVPCIQQINLEVSLFTTLFILGLIFAGCIRFGDSLKKLKRMCLVDMMFGSTTLLLSFYSVPMMIYFQGEFFE